MNEGTKKVRNDMLTILAGLVMPIYMLVINQSDIPT